MARQNWSRKNLESYPTEQLEMLLNVKGAPANKKALVQEILDERESTPKKKTTRRKTTAKKPAAKTTRNAAPKKTTARRGRPAKKVVQEEMELPEETPTKRRRGRPAKNETPATKKRGRPAKKVVEEIEEKPKAKRGRPAKAAPKKVAKKATKKAPAKKATKKEKPYELPYDLIEPNELLTNAQLKKHGKLRGRVIDVSPDILEVRENFNVRQDYGDIEGLAQSIAHNGILVPLRGDMLDDGTILITDGHRRLEAVDLLIEQGTDVLTVPVEINDKKTTEEDRIFHMFITGDNKSLTDIEMAELFGRLINLGYTQEDISKRIGKSIQTVSNYLKLSRLPKKTKEQIRKGEISKTQAINTTRGSRKARGNKKGGYIVEVAFDEDGEDIFTYLGTTKAVAVNYGRILKTFMDYYEIEYLSVEVFEKGNKGDATIISDEEE